MNTRVVKLNKKVLVFLFCVLISTFFWFLSHLSKEYNAKLKVPVEYSGFPKNKVVSNNLPAEIELQVKATGFTLLMYRFRDKLDPVRVDGSYIQKYKKDDLFYFSTNSRTETWADELGERMKILKVSPDTLFFNFSSRSTRTVPVKANVSVKFEKEFNLKSNIVTVPSSVKISGAKDVIDKIKYVETEKLELKGVDKPVSRQLKIIIKQSKHIDLSHKTVTVNIPVSKFTEGRTDVPVQVINLPEGASIKTFPDKAEVKYRVPLEDFDKINPSAFKVIADYSKAKSENNYLKIELEAFPKNVQLPKLSPSKVEYIIRK